MHDTRIAGTHDLITSDRVIGTDVYGQDGEHIGSIEHLVLEKRSGKVAYAVLSFGGFLGIGDDYYPLPWLSLAYDENLKGYRVNVTRDQLEGAPKYRPAEEYDWSAESGRRVHDHYGVLPYWL